MAPQLVNAPHSQLPAAHVLDSEQLDADMHMAAKQLPVEVSQRLAPQVAPGFTRQSGVHTPRESSSVTDSQT